MRSVSAIFRNGRVELGEAVDWPEGTPVKVTALERDSARSTVDSRLAHWPEGFFDKLREQWGNEPFERPPQGEFEEREHW